MHFFRVEQAYFLEYVRLYVSICFNFIIVVCSFCNMFYDGHSWCENRCSIENDRFNEAVEKGRERTKG